MNQLAFFQRKFCAESMQIRIDYVMCPVNISHKMKLSYSMIAQSEKIHNNSEENALNTLHIYVTQAFITR